MARTPSPSPSPYTPEAMTARRDELRAQEASLRSQLDPLQAERDELVNANRAAEKVLNDQVIALNDQLYPIMQELVTLNRALPGHRSPDGQNADAAEE